MTYQEAKEYLEQTSKKGIILGLEPIRGLLEELGNPQEDLQFVHLAGTNGKGSVLAFTASILGMAGYRTGQYTSPALISRREQIQINGEWITKDKFAELVMEVKDAVTRLKESDKALPTVYEVETAMAFLYFKKEKCDIVVLETGMGGRDDATNVVRNTLVAGFTSISLDHMSFLGETIEEIATVKAGIIKPGSVVVSGIQKQSVLNIIESTILAIQAEQYDKVPSIIVSHREEANDAKSAKDAKGVKGAKSLEDAKSMKGTGATDAKNFKGTYLSCVYVLRESIKIIEETYNSQIFTYKESEPYTIQMAGSHQVENAGIALEIINSLQTLGFKISDEHIKSGLSQTRFFGRFTALGEKPVFIVDGAHNEDGVLRLRDNLANLFPNRKITFIMGIYKDKKVAKIVKTILPLAKAIYTVSLFNKERAITAKELKTIYKDYYMKALNNKKHQYVDSNSEAITDDLEITACTSIKEAVELAIVNAGEDGVVIAFGSLSYLWTVAKEKVELEKTNGS